MGNPLQLARNLLALNRTILQAIADHRRRSKYFDVLNDAERADWLHVWCRTLLERFQIPCEVVGTPPQSGLIASNHLSYLDIIVFSAAVPAVFVSKSEVRNWPVFGALSKMAGTVFVDRRRKTDTWNANEGIRRLLQAGIPVVVYPEGTSSNGKEVLRFYPSLFEPAVESAVPITAAHIGYELQDGDVGKDVAYWGDMTFFPHLLKLLSKRGLSASVKFSSHPHTFTERKAAATAIREEVLKLH